MTLPNPPSSREKTALSFPLLLARTIAAASFLWLAAWTATAMAQEAQHVAGTTVTLVPLEGMEPAQDFSGFGNAQTQASILVAELPAEARAQLAPLFEDLNVAKGAFVTQGVIVETLDTVTTDAGVEAALVRGTQSMGGDTYDKWIALLHGDRTVMITVQAPETAGLDAEAVDAMIRSVALGDAATVESKLEALPFDVSAVEPFRVVDTIAGSGVLMTAGELDVDPEGSQPMLIVAFQISEPVSVSMQEQAAELLLSQTEGLSDIEIVHRGAKSFAGGEGIELRGTASEDGRDKGFIQYLTVGERGRFIRLIVIADEAGVAEIEPAVEAVAASVAFRD